MTHENAHCKINLGIYGKKWKFMQERRFKNFKILYVDINVFF